jgi:hypothetical protein
MFFEGERIVAVREMILADNETGRRKALAKLLPIQRSDFEGLFAAMNGAARHYSAAWIRRYMNLCRTTTHRSASWPPTCVCRWERSRCEWTSCTNSTP